MILKKVKPKMQLSFDFVSHWLPTT